MLNYLLSVFSEWLYRTIEIFDAFVIISKKLNRSLEFRRHWRNSLRNQKHPVKLWIHGASVGELEDLASFFLDQDKISQASLKYENIMITASSVSASQKLDSWSKEYPFAYCGPIPPEKKSDCVEFLNTLKPEKLLLSHTDVWPVLFYHAAKLVPGGLIWLPQKNVPLSFIKKLFLVPWLKLHILRFPEWKSPFKSFFVGNPRVSRILSRIENKINLKKLHILEAFYAEPVKGKFNLIIGSAWFEDLEVLSRALNLLTPAENLQWNIVVIPHDPQDSHEVARMKQVLPKGRILLEEGILLEAYEGFDLAFVGGGFGLGLHNIIEPALWKIPTLCGPYIDKQPEASWLRDLGQLVILNGAEDLAEELRNLLSEKYRILRKDACDTAYQKLLEHKDSINRLISCLKGV
jgi:3-deoxy-D-manno-octulosonic-acid transferase